MNNALLDEKDYNNLIDLIVKLAKEYAEKGFEEKPNNGGFFNAQFDREMRNVGFVNGHAWCMYFAKLVYNKAGVLLGLQDFVKRVNSCMNGSTQDSFNRCDRAEDFDTTKFKLFKKIKKGSIVIYKFGNTAFGHAGIVIEDSYFWSLQAITIKSVDGNSNNNGSREGTKIVIKTRRSSFTPSSMFIKGIILPKLKSYANTTF